MGAGETWSRVKAKKRCQCRQTQTEDSRGRGGQRVLKCHKHAVQVENDAKQSRHSVLISIKYATCQQGQFQLKAMGCLKCQRGWSLQTSFLNSTEFITFL